MRVDDYEPQITSFDVSLKSSGDAQFNSITHLYIGKNETMREGFVGCKYFAAPFIIYVPFSYAFNIINTFPSFHTKATIYFKASSNPEQKKQTKIMLNHYYFRYFSC